MQHKDFVNRKAELEFLQEAFEKKKPQLLLIYGRRRVGKTCLIEHFLRGKGGIYFLSSKGNEAEQIGMLSLALAERFNDTALKLNPFKEWHSLFAYLYEKGRKERILLAIDEFPFLMQSNPAIGSILMKYWDEYLSKIDILLVLCGSSISMMESAGISYGSPLYGRRTGQWKVMPLKFRDYSKLFGEKRIESIIEFYAITGGIAFYVTEMELEKGAYENILLNIAKKGKMLYEEGEILVKEELKEPATYFSILHAIASGKTKPSEISNAIGVPVTSLSGYFATLARLNFIKRATSVTEPANTKKAAYAISDNFLLFWFKFVYPNRSHIEENDIGKIKTGLANFNAYVGAVFEDICKEALSKIAPFEIEKAGKWWGNYREETGAKKTEEIDIVAINSKTSEILFAECKWKDNVDAPEVLEGIKAKSAHVNWRNEERKEHFCIIAKSFKRKVDEKNVILFDLKNLEKALGV